MRNDSLNFHQMFGMLALNVLLERDIIALGMCIIIAAIIISKK